jgi:hypothetical protein
MNSREDAIFDATQRAQLFLDQNAALLMALDLTSARQQLAEVVRCFTDCSVDQQVSNCRAQRETATQRQLRRQLRQELMAPIAVIAQWTLYHVPEFRVLQLPKRSGGEEEFLASARAMAEAAGKYHDTLVAKGLPPTLIDELQSAVAQLAESLEARAVHRRISVSATRSLAMAARDGQAVLRVLDALVRRAAGGNESLLQSWQAARCTHRSGGKTTTSAVAA